ncbi:MAG: phytoene desaturase family protein [Myxococcales bacterium]|nr:phytoene desaturase family protein [Myxococcota bacterium]MDW8282811.1 phytoene desaturase family protein [Myxococcales bacterium]
MAVARSTPVVIIGAGVGGLSAAVLLAAAGLPVTVLERAARPGGKMREVMVGGVPFDAGPTVLTMPWVLDEIFQAAGERRDAWVRFQPLEPTCRHVFPGGLVLDLFADQADAAEPWARSAAEIGRVLGARAAEQYRRFRRHARGIYQAIERPFLRQALPRTPLGLLTRHPADALGLLRLDARRTLWQSLCRFFDDEPLRVLFARYATYAGSDPFRAPATLALIAHVELAFGVHEVQGGMYRLAEALAQLAERRGARLVCGADVERVELDARGRRAIAVHVAGERIPAEAVLVNCDVVQLYERLLAGTRVGERGAAQLRRLEPSLSARLLLVLARDAEHLPLAAHNVFFSSDYAREFAQLRQRVPEDPTVYLCRTRPPSGAAGLSRWFFLVNAPPLPAGADVGEPQRLRSLVADKLRTVGADLDRHAAAEVEVAPADFAEQFPGSRGALYGSASNAPWSAFVRPRNRAPGLDNVYCVGGSTHPGAGVPMVALSAQIASHLLLSDLGRG